MLAPPPPPTYFLAYKISNVDVFLFQYIKQFLKINGFSKSQFTTQCYYVRELAFFPGFVWYILKVIKCLRLWWFFTKCHNTEYISLTTYKHSRDISTKKLGSNVAAELCSSPEKFLLTDRSVNKNFFVELYSSAASSNEEIENLVQKRICIIYSLNIFYCIYI